MSWTPPVWMSPEDIEAEQRLLAAVRSTIHALRERADKATSEQDFVAWRWRVDAVTGEVNGMLRRLKPGSTS